MLYSLQKQIILIKPSQASKHTYKHTHINTHAHKNTYTRMHTHMHIHTLRKMKESNTHYFTCVPYTCEQINLCSFLSFSRVCVWWRCVCTCVYVCVCAFLCSDVCVFWYLCHVEVCLGRFKRYLCLQRPN